MTPDEAAEALYFMAAALTRYADSNEWAAKALDDLIAAVKEAE